MWAAGSKPNRAKTLFDKYVSTLTVKYYSNCFPIYIWSQGVAALASAQASVNVSSARSVHCVQRLAWPLPSNNRIGIDITIIASPELGSSDAD